LQRSKNRAEAVRIKGVNDTKRKARTKEDRLKKKRDVTAKTN
jgi:hypothetical protein